MSLGSRRLHSRPASLLLLARFPRVRIPWRSVASDFSAHAEMLWPILHRAGVFDRRLRRCGRLLRGRRFRRRFIRCVARHLQRYRHAAVNRQRVGLGLGLRVQCGHISFRNVVNYLRFCSRRGRRFFRFSRRLRRNWRLFSAHQRRQRADGHERRKKESDKMEAEWFHAMPRCEAAARQQNLSAGSADGSSFTN